MPAIDPMDEVTFVDQYVAAYCDALEGCCQSAQIPFGRAECEQSAVTEAQSLKGSGTTEFNPQAGAKCISGLRWFGQICPTTGAITILGPGITCGGVYQGSVAAGSPCGSRSECSVPEGGSALCMPLSYPGSDVCITFDADRGPGEPCTTAYEDVAEHHSCVEGYDCNDDTGICEQECEGGLGADCSNQSCATGLRCGDDDTCVPWGAPGDACSRGLDCYGSCESGVCTQGLDAESCYSGN